MDYRNFLQRCKELEQLGFGVVASTNRINKFACIIVQRQVIGTLSQDEEGAFTLELGNKEFKWRDSYSIVQNRGVHFWFGGIPPQKTVAADGDFSKILLPLRNKLKSYSRKVQKNDEFKKLSTQEQNAYILPFFIGMYYHKVCSAMLEHNVQASSVLLLLVEADMMKLDEVAAFKDLPENELGDLLWKASEAIV